MIIRVSSNDCNIEIKRENNISRYLCYTSLLLETIPYTSRKYLFLALLHSILQNLHTIIPAEVYTLRAISTCPLPIIINRHFLVNFICCRSEKSTFHDLLDIYFLIFYSICILFYTRDYCSEAGCKKNSDIFFLLFSIL